MSKIDIKKNLFPTTYRLILWPFETSNTLIECGSISPKKSYLAIQSSGLSLVLSFQSSKCKPISPFSSLSVLPSF